MMERVTEQLNYWLSDSYFDEKTKEELLAVRNDEKEIEDRFYKDLAFGTGGLRGVIGAGTNRMNIYTVRKATQGLANYINKNGDPKKGVAISYDSRRMSPEFAKETALCLAANGIKAYLSDTLRPVPEESFALRYFGCQAGVEITASHNPPEYNGYKVYWEDGAQVTPPHDTGIISDVNAVSSYDEVKTMPEKEAVEKGLLVYFGREIDDAYMEALKKQIIHPEVIREMADDIRIVYTPFHGAGLVPVTRVLEELGFKHVYVVPEQKDPDPDFTTVGYPNPEDPRGFALAEKLGKKVGADLLIATDPDSDRMAVELPDGKGGFRPLNGNQTGAMLIAYMAESQKAAGTLPENGAMIKSIVTGDMGKTICKSYGIRVFETLTGFKNICGVIPRLEKEGYRYFFAYEESIGCAPGERVRDKDGIAAGLLMMEMAAFYKKKGMTPGDALEALYKRYGYFAERQVSLIRKGQTGAEEIARIMRKAREEKPDRFGEFRVAEVTDYLHGWKDIPPSNVLKFRMENGDWFAMRPSGTEPKLKFYFYTRAENSQDAGRRADGLRDAVLEALSADR